MTCESMYGFKKANHLKKKDVAYFRVDKTTAIPLYYKIVKFLVLKGPSFAFPLEEVTISHNITLHPQKNSACTK